jgi:uncharacterized protein (TIGR03067 family)
VNRFTILLAALCCAIGVAASGERGAQSHDTQNVATDLEKFQGTWTVERVEAEGKEVPIALFKDMTLTFEGDKYTVKVGDQVVQAGTHKLDSSKSPKTFDDTVVVGTNQATVIVGIYEISGDTLKFCFDPQGKLRPTEFKTAPGSQTTLGVYERVKK